MFRALVGDLPEDVTPHVLRHSFASLAADFGFADATVAALLGHVGQTMTSRYQHSADAVLLKAADAVADETARSTPENFQFKPTVPMKAAQVRLLGTSTKLSIETTPPLGVLTLDREMGNFDRALTGSTRLPSYLQADVLDDLQSARDDATGTKVAAMPSGPGERYDFFLSRRGSVASIAREVTDVLTEKGYRILVQDYDTPLGASFVGAMHEAVINSRDLIILFTEDYLRSPYTRKEFTSFEAERLKTSEERHIVVLRCEDVPLRGLLADNVYQTLVGIDDPEERKRRIIAAAERQSQAAPPPLRPFIGVPPRIASFTGRIDELDRLDAILMQDKPAAVTQASVGRVAVQGMGGEDFAGH
jgi:TIR domain/Phage integrase family